MAINFDYNQTIEQAKLLDELVSEIQNKCADKLGDVRDNIEASWSGESSKAYLRYIEGVREDLQNKAKYMRDAAEFLRTAAQKLQAADLAAKQAAESI